MITAREQYNTILIMYILGMILFGMVAIRMLLADRIIEGCIGILLCLLIYWLMIKDKIKNYVG